MLDPQILDLGYDTAAEILTSVGGRDLGVATVDLRGEVIWQNGAEFDGEIREALRQQLDSGVSPVGASCEVGDRGGLTLHAICDGAENPLAWLVSWSEEVVVSRSATRDWKRTCETLPRVAAMLTRECALAHELSGAVTDLGNRYEELNIVYRMEEESRTAETQDQAVWAMLQSFLAHLQIDVGVLIAPGADAPIVGRGNVREIANVDLVVTELEGKVWRYISASRDPLVINESNDERRRFLLTNMPFKLLAFPNDGCEGPDGGLLLLRHLDAPDFTNSDMSLARVFFGQAMILLRNQGLLNQMKRFTRQIASSLVETVEAKDPYTRGHSERVERITAGIGREAGVEEGDFPDLLWGALLHDIGKIGVPDAILMKPGRLTADEYTFIKTHPNRSYEILRHVEALGPAALDAARYHQERFDGAGYPFGLTGDEIPLVARVVAVADTYDAVTSSRSYRAASSHEKAMRIISEVSGQQLDPELVRIFEGLVASDAGWLDDVRPERPGHIHG